MNIMPMTMREPLKILLVEDVEVDAELSLRELKRSGIACTGRRVETEPDFRHQLEEFQPQVILSDFSMPQFNGMAALAIAHQVRPDIPFIFVSGTLGEEYAIRALKSGADDYVLKDNLVRLPPTVERAILDAKVATLARQTEEALQHSEQRFRLAVSTGDVWDWTVATGEAYISPQWKERHGYGDNEIENTAAAWLALLDPQDREAVLRAFNAHVLHKVPYDIEYRARTKAGEYRWSHAKGLALWDENDKATYMAGTVIDITARKLAEIKIMRLNRVYAMLSGINTLIVHAKNREDLFHGACRIAVEAGHFRMAWVGLVDAAAGRIAPVAWHGAGDEYIEMMPLGLSDDDVATFGLAGRAVTEFKPMVIEDMQSDPRVSLKEEALEQDFRSLAILPLTVGGLCVGVFSLYSSETGFFDATEMKLLRELAGDITFALDHIEKAERLNYLAFFDALTGLANRPLFYERLAQHIEAIRRERHKLAVLVINVDRFKTINDTLGRQTGDELLKKMAQRFEDHARDGVWYARIESDHFAVVIPDIKSAEELARRMESDYREYFSTPFHIGEAELRISARFGIAMYPDDGESAETLLRNAEAAVKKARASGERYIFYTQEMTDKIADSLTLENQLRLGLERNEFVLYYQPKVDANTRRILSVEALIRWQNPKLGLVPPAHFIPLMEETGLIKEVGAWALRQAALDHLRWQDELGQLGIPVPRIAVNVSPVQLRKRDFVDTVRTAIVLGACPPGIDLEITESLIMEDIEENIVKLEQIRELGLSIAIDDFGTGYSSLRYLAKLPVQTLKIDRSFVITMLDDPDTMTLVSTVISLAHSLRLKVVAEGVDAEAQAEVLRKLQCDEMQGYLFSRPLPMADVTKLLLAPV
ncbi:MAG TPA: EAL domain-containing protein [Burkholderiaceae bacterium]|nr:EAL domain-containing protein [Burkholderiaceae bacterium]